MTLAEDTVELPSGKTTTYLRQALTDGFAVAVIAMNEKREILLQKEYSYPPNEVLWQLPGGGSLANESIEAAANRELSEECDLVASSCEVIGSFLMDNRRSDIKQYVVLCTDLHQKPGQRDDEEFIEMHWVSPAKLPTMIESGELHQAYMLAALNIWFAKTGQLTF